MLIHPTVERLRSLGLAAMADTLVELQNNPEAAEMSHADWLGLLIDSKDRRPGQCSGPYSIPNAHFTVASLELENLPSPS